MVNQREIESILKSLETIVKEMEKQNDWEERIFDLQSRIDKLSNQGADDVPWM